MLCMYVTVCVKYANKFNKKKILHLLGVTDVLVFSNNVVSWQSFCNCK